MRPTHLQKYWDDVKAGRRKRPAKAKPTSVTRVVRVESSRIKGRQLEVTLHYHGEIEVRIPRTRVSYTMSVEDCYVTAAMHAANRIDRLTRKYRKEDFITWAEARRKARREVLGV